jgi:hypothetical protein
MREQAIRLDAERQQRRRELEHEQAELDARIEALLRHRNLKRAELETFAGVGSAAGVRQRSDAEEVRRLRRADVDGAGDGKRGGRG